MAEGVDTGAPATLPDPLMSSHPGRAAQAVAATITALILMLAVYLLNGAPLFYHDTGGYLEQGHDILQALGISPSETMPSRSPGDAAPAIAPAADKTVQASRSAIYGLALAAIDVVGPLDLAVLANVALIWAATFLVARRFAGPAPYSASFLTAAALSVASLSALPFYVAFLMPDILAPVLLLMLALLGAFWGEMRGWERAAAAGLAVAAILCHPSHLLTAAAFLPFGLIASPLLTRRRLVVLGAVAAALVGIGVVERVAFVAGVERLGGRQVQMLPFLTARLIEDGPGLDFLEAHCPDRDLATCALLGALSQSDDPARLLSHNILFARDPAIGSLRRLDSGAQAAISAEQLDFSVRVIAEHPVGVTGALGSNTLTQLGYVRVDMTLPRPGLLESVQVSYGKVVGDLRGGRLIDADRAWLEPLASLHRAVYLISIASLLFLLVRPGGLPAGSRSLIVLVFIGLVVHAAVCGGISVPAHRYGARVAIVLPILATILSASAFWNARGPVGSGRAGGPMRPGLLQR